MRGTPASRSLSPRPNGIIPAYAGNTSAPRGAVERIGDHPRVCGEHVPSAAMGMIGSGSSPRMRGTLWPLFAADRKRRIIPAYAGNTRSQRVELAWRRDHPRVCGEHSDSFLSHGHRAGSSPRMRGTREFDRLRDGCVGIIPAYAGNTLWTSVTPTLIEDHPRVCGEHIVWVCHASSYLGSSPRMRGTHRLKRRRIVIIGIIPAYAGNTSNLSPCSR